VVLTRKQKGVLLTLLGVIAFSPDALLVRLIHTDVYSMIMFKGGLMSVALTPCIWLLHRGHLRRMWQSFGGIDVAFGVIFALTMFAFVSSLGMTSVANVLVMIALGPLFSATFAKLILGEPVSYRLALTILACFVGVSIIVSNEFWRQFSGANGALDLESLLGCLVAMLASALIGLNMVLRRMSRMEDSMPGLVLGGIVAALMALPFAQVGEMNATQIGYAVLLGCVVMPLANTFTFIGPRYISAPEVSVLWLLEVVLGPLWVWLVLLERPSLPTVIGGSVVVASLLVYFLGRLRRETIPLDKRMKETG